MEATETTIESLIAVVLCVPAMGTGTWGMRDKFKFTRKIWKYE